MRAAVHGGTLNGQESVLPQKRPSGSNQAKVLTGSLTFATFSGVVAFKLPPECGGRHFCSGMAQPAAELTACRNAQKRAL